MCAGVAERWVRCGEDRGRASSDGWGDVAGSVPACGSPGACSLAVLEPQRLAAQARNPTLPFGEVGFDPLLSEERKLLGVLLPHWAVRQLQVQKTRSHLSQGLADQLSLDWLRVGRHGSLEAEGIPRALGAVQVPGQLTWLSVPLCWRATS